MSQVSVDPVVSNCDVGVFSTECDALSPCHSVQERGSQGLYCHLTDNQK